MFCTFINIQHGQTARSAALTLTPNNLWLIPTFFVKLIFDQIFKNAFCETVFGEACAKSGILGPHLCLQRSACI